MIARSPCSPSTVFVLLALSTRMLTAEDQPALTVAPRTQKAPGLERMFDSFLRGPNSSLSFSMRLDTLLKQQVAEVERCCNATEPQLAKLRFAGRRDIERFVDEVEELRTQLRTRAAEEGVDVRLTESFRARLRIGLFNEESLFGKSLLKNFTPEQLDAYRQGERELHAFQHRAKVQVVVALWDERVSLRADQRNRLTEVLLQGTQVPASLGKDDPWVILAQAANLPQDRFTAILDEWQWQLVRPTLERAKRLEPRLREQNLMPSISSPAKAAP